MRSIGRFAGGGSRSGIHDLLALDFGDAGGLKTYHDGLGVLRDNDLGGGSFAYRKHAHYWDGSAWVLGGFLTEPVGTNEIRNNTMQGGVSGNPGTDPTHWETDGPESGFQQELSFGVEDGIEYMDLRIFGTTTASGKYFVHFEGTQQIAALQSEVLTNAFYSKLAAGTLTGISDCEVRMIEKTSGGASSGSAGSFAISPDSVLKRVSGVYTMADAAAAFVQPGFRFSYANATAVDVTLRIGLPQVEENDHVTSLIKTTTAAVTRVADTASISLPIFDATQGTFVWSAMSNGPLTATRWICRFFDDSGASDAIGTYISSSAVPNINYKVGGTPEDEGTGTFVQNVKSTVAACYDNSASRLSIDGAISAGSRVMVGPPAGIAEFYIATQQDGLGGLSGFIPRLDYYGMALADADLERRSA